MEYLTMISENQYSIFLNTTYNKASTKKQKKIAFLNIMFSYKIDFFNV